MHQLVDVVAVSVPTHGQLDLTFSDGTTARIDVAKRVPSVGVFAVLFGDQTLFARATVDRERGVVAWPNGADLDSDQLHAWAHGLDAPPWATTAA